jgi:Zn-dependent peptidase ImmA (M78 family)
MPTKTKPFISLHNKKVSLNFIDVDLVITKPDFANDNMSDCYGQYHRRKNLIEIQHGLSDLDEINTIVHELFHLIAYASGEVTAGCLKDDTDEERLVNNFANLLITLFRQNAWLLEYLQQRLSDNDHNKK